MPYLLQNSENRVENIKKKFENSYLVGNDGNAPRNLKSPTSPSKTKATQGWKSGILENESDSCRKHELQRDKHTGKSVISRSDGKALVRRSPAFRREKLNYGKSLTCLSDINGNPTEGQRKFCKVKILTEKSNSSDETSTIKLKHDLLRNNTEPNLLQFSQNINSSYNNELNSNRISKCVPLLNQENEKYNHCDMDDKILVQCSTTNKNTSQKSTTSDSKHELKITDSIRLALKAPLPKGPPPKKPPRTFLHTMNDCKDVNNQDPFKTVVGKEDPTLRLKLEKIEKVVKSLDHRNQNVPLEGNKLELLKPSGKLNDSNESNKTASQPVFGKPVENNYLKSLSCIKTEDSQECESQSCFFVDHPKDGKDCIKTDVVNSHLNGKPLPLLVKRGIVEPIYDLPCISKVTSFKSFGKVSGESGGSVNPPQQLHYMCTDITSVLNGRPQKFSSVKHDNCLSKTMHNELPNDKTKNIFNTSQTVKRNCQESFDAKTENSDLTQEPKNVIAKEEMKVIMNNVFNSVSQKRIDKNLYSLNVNIDSESGSASSDTEEMMSRQKDKSSRAGNLKQLDDRHPLSSHCKREAFLSQASASRKTYVKRFSSKLLDHAPNSKAINAESYNHLFESCILVGLTLGESKTTVPYIKSIFPQSVKPPPLIEALCFPDASTWSQSSCHLQQGEQYYSLVITNESGERKFGYCRRVLPEGGNFCLPLVYCIISPHRASGFYYKVLQELESRHGASDILTFIKQLYECSFPGPGQSLKLKKILEEVTRVSPIRADNCLPSTLVRRPCDVRLEEKDLSQLLQHLKVTVLLKLFSSLLLERKVILLGNSLRNLSSCIEALQSLLNPFSWQHTFIPVLPDTLNELCEAPTPFVIGLQKSTLTTEFLATLNFEDGIIIDLEESTIIKCCGDEGSIIPQRLIKGLKTALNLALNASLESENDRNVLISEAFIRFFVEICGNYSYYIIKQPDGRKIFQKEEFVNSAPYIQSFLDWFVETAMFRSFIEERIQNDIEDLFRRRTMEHMEETDKITTLFLKNYKGMNKKVKSLGDRIKDLTLFAK